MKTQNTHTFGRGRGSNPASRKNLTAPVYDAYVYERGAGIGWAKVFGPMTYRRAYDTAAKLESMNRSACKPMYAAGTGNL
jgi:hypothetical protein